MNNQKSVSVRHDVTQLENTCYNEINASFCDHEIKKNLLTGSHTTCI